MTVSRHKLFIIDGMAIAYRAHFALIHSPLVTADGRHISATFGFLNAMFKIIRDENPDMLAVAFDAKQKTFRHIRYPEYKATREKMPFEMRPQIQWIKDILQAMNIPVLEVPGFEADDIIGSLAVKAEKENIDTYMVSGDKDFMQLINEHIFLYAPATGKRPLTIYGSEEVVEKWGVAPERIIDLLALMGDSADHIPGIPGIGEKSAVKLLAQYGDFESVLAHGPEQKNKRIREGIAENAELGRLSRELVIIKTDMDLTVSWKELAVNDEYDKDSLADLLNSLELNRFVAELGLSSSGEDLSPNVDQRYVCCDTLQKVKDLVSILSEADVISVDTETDGLDPLNAPLVGLSFSKKAWEAYYVPYTPEFFDILIPLLENEAVKKVGQNIKFDEHVLSQYNVSLNGVIFDTMIAAYLLHPDQNSYKLEILCDTYIHYHMMPITELIGSKKSQQIPMSSVPLDQISFYAAEDADICFQLYEIFSKKLLEEDLMQIMSDLEVPLLQVLRQMEANGVYVDIPFLKKMSNEIGKDMTGLMEDIYDLAGGVFNINSPKQLSQILFEKLALPVVKKTKTGYSTDVTVLEKLSSEHPLPAKILTFRTLSKLRSTYVDALPQLLNAKTGRIHGSFNQTVAATGRLSSSNPNFQNIPIRTERGREIRKAFCAQDPSWNIIAADYSQIELRVMAHLSSDANLLEAFQQDKDVHTRTAASVFNIPDEDVTADQRRTAKVINFGIMYGAGAHRVSQELKITHSEAAAIIAAYFSRYSGVKTYIDSTVAFAKEHTYVETLMGRKRRTLDINSENHNLQEAAKRAAINMPVQGTAADIIKLAMIAVQNEINSLGLSSRMILQVHDELVFEVPDNEMEQMKELIQRNMEGVVSLDVPLKVDLGFGKHWHEAH